MPVKYPTTSTSLEYQSFLERKAQLGEASGFAPVWMPDFLYDFQAALTTWAIRGGRRALLEDCGLGKTPQLLVWAENVVRKTGGRVLIVTPLAVSHQTVREGAKFGIEVRRSDDGKSHTGITVTNYERLHLFDPTDFVGTVCDESSAIKAFHGVRREIVTDFMRKHQYRLLTTATPAPNDYIELGTSAEALGMMNRTDMLERFFKNDDGTSLHARAKWTGQKPDVQQHWRFKGHAEMPFWRWVCSWARALRKPSDLGFSDERFALPPLVERPHIVKARTVKPGMLFEVAAIGLAEEREEVRRTLQERCETAAELVNGTGHPAIVWCNLNDEGTLLAKLIPDAVEVAGHHSDEYKEEAILGFLNGTTRVLVSKPRIFGWGLNLQHCAHMVYFPSHSYEAYYQALRRCWRFGQRCPVTVDIVTTEGQVEVMADLQAKARAADRMFSALVQWMNDAIRISETRPMKKENHPAWLSTIR